MEAAQGEPVPDLPQEFIARPEIMCESCGENPATATYRIRNQYEKRLCEGCGMTYHASFGEDVKEV
jgi:formylmethanofuran dehydrogenase subunit E